MALRGFVDDNKLRGGSTFLEEVAGKTIVRNARRKSPPGKQIRCILAMVIWWKIVPSDLGLDFVETFPCDFSIVLNYLMQIRVSEATLKLQ
jgi:hypothetical protein